MIPAGRPVQQAKWLTNNHTQLAGGACIMLLVVILSISMMSHSGVASRGTRAIKLRLPLLNGAPAGAAAQPCSLDFLRYEPSHWEDRWRTGAEGLQKQICDTMLREADLVDVWMGSMNDSFSTGVAAAELLAMQGDEVFSHFRYRDSCSGREVVAPIEPLVGLLRHPTTHTNCSRTDPPGNWVDFTHSSPAMRVRFSEPTLQNQWLTPHGTPHIENKGYMVIQPLSVDSIAQLYPGRKILFDLGTGRYASGSLPWFMSVFEAKGIVFDDIYGWEVQKINQSDYWNEFPADISYKMHFRNVPCSIEPDSPRNPLNIIRKIYKPGDYIVFKLDIDNETIEKALMVQLDADILPMMAEFFFEQHFDCPEMRQYFGQNLATKYPQVLQLFHQLRSQGLRLHYWP